MARVLHFVRTFVSTLLELAVVRGLLDEVEQFSSQSFICDGPGYMYIIS